MQQQIRGWRFAAERTHRRRGARDVPLACSARMMGGTAVMACRALGRMAMRARTRPRPGIPQLSVSRLSMPRPSMPAAGTTTMKRAAGRLALMAAGMGVAGWAASRSRATPKTLTTRDRAPKNRWIMVTSTARLSGWPRVPTCRSRSPGSVTPSTSRSAPRPVTGAPSSAHGCATSRVRRSPEWSCAGRRRTPGTWSKRHCARPRRSSRRVRSVRPDWPPSAQPAQVGKLVELAGRRGARR